MSVAQPNLPGSGTTLRILRDDGVTFVGITVPSEMLWPGPVGARLAQSPGLSAAEQGRARGVALTPTRQPREPSMEGPGWAIYSFPGTQQLYVLRDDGTHLSWGASAGLFTPARAAGVISATPGLSPAELARLTSILGGAVAGGGTPTPTPSFTTNPSFTGTPTVGQPVSALTFTDGTIANGSVTSRAYLLAGTAVALSYVFQAGDVGASFVFQNTGTGGITASSTPVTVAAAGAAVAPVPSNLDFIHFGDSRTENGLSATYTAGSTGPNYQQRTRGIGGWIAQASDGKFRNGRNGNFGINSGTTGQAAVDPRQPGAASPSATVGQWYRGSAPASGSDNKGYVQAASHPAGNVIFLLGTNGYSNADALTIINALTAAGKVVWVLNEMTKGVDSAGTVQATYAMSSVQAAAFKAYSDYLNSLDYASGSPNANPKVIVVDSWNDSYDTTSGNLYRNKRGVLGDGLHPTVAYARKLAQLVVARAKAAWGTSYYNALPSTITQPVSNGASIAADSPTQPHLPYLNSNPILTPGTAGSIAGTWSTAPVAANVPQGWSVLGANVAGVSAVVDKTQTDPDGYPATRLTLSGTVGAVNGGTTVTLRNQVTKATLDALIAGGQLSLNDKLRGAATIAVAAGSVNLGSAQVKITMWGDTVAKNQIATGSTSNNFATFAEFLDAGDGSFLRQQTEVIDLAEPNMATTPGALTAFGSNGIFMDVVIEFEGAVGDALSAVITVSRAGVLKVGS